MCGIVGYIGTKKVDNVLLRALSRLEYRGYDSAGVATLNEGQISILKSQGKLNRLFQLATEAPLYGNMGIGHTRWATHGEPSNRNAHPHGDCSGQIAVVHNGIIENHAEIRVRLMQAGHKIESDTDTEVLAHLVEEYHLKEGLDLQSAVQKMLKDIQGSYAFCVLSSKENERFIAARNGSPLVVGLGENENFIASDAPALLDYTRNVIFLEDYQLANVTREGVEVFSIKGEPVNSTITQIDFDAKDVSKEGFEHYMLKEIEEQTKVLDRIIRTRITPDFEINIFDELKISLEDLKGIDRILIQACGTSWHAGSIGKYMFESIAQIPVEVDVSSEFRYRTVLTRPRTLVLSITQSGETLDTLMGLRKGRECGYKTLSICNVLGSTIARESDGVIYTHAGPEIGVASTKAYTAQLTILFLLSLKWAQLKGTIDQERYMQLVNELKQVPEKMQQVIDHKYAIRKVAEKYFHARDFLFLARGINYPNAHEGALKIKEVAYIHATGHAAGEMKHGPIALIDKNMPIVAIAQKSAIYEKMVSNIQEVKARSGRVIAITTEGNSSLEAFADDILYVPETDELLSPLLTVLPLQYLAYYVAVLKGTDVDQPRNLAKSVTVE
jgi:glutamine---fructose-6-phosphate transaminase (isomerizing)